MTNRIGRLILGLAALAAGIGCVLAQTASEATPEPTPAPAPQRAVAQIGSASGSKVRGSATFTQDGATITLRVSLEHAPPGVHAVHLHEKGDCSAPDATSAGGHWNPSSHAHGEWGTAPFHLGDVGNLVIGADGNGALLLTTELWSIGSKAANDVVGTAIIVHAAPDDFKTQPTGNAGARIGCGVVRPE